MAKDKAKTKEGRIEAAKLKKIEIEETAKATKLLKKEKIKKANEMIANKKINYYQKAIDKLKSKIEAPKK